MIGTTCWATNASWANRLTVKNSRRVVRLGPSNGRCSLLRSSASAPTQERRGTSSDECSDISCSAPSAVARSAPTLPTPLRGIFPVLVTPFHDDGEESIDVDGLRRCISFMHEIGCHGVTIAGVLGESNRMTDFETRLLIEAAVDVVKFANGRQHNNTALAEDTGTRQGPFRVCVGGMTHPGTAATVALCEMAAEIGADAVMVSPTADTAAGGGGQPPDDALFHLLERVAAACPQTSIVLQDLPSSSGVRLPIALISHILHDIPQVTTVKLESLPTIQRMVALRDSTDSTKTPYSILTGLGALYSGFDLQGGRCDGFMTGFAFPEILLAMFELAQEGRCDKVHEVYQKYLPLIVLEQQPVGGLAIRKEIYRRRGLIASSHLRHPGKCLPATMEGILDEQLKRSFPEINIGGPIPWDAIVGR